MKSKILLNLIFQKVFDYDIIYVISKYFKKVWSIDTTHVKKFKIKNSKREKQKHSFHYYYH